MMNHFESGRRISRYNSQRGPLFQKESKADNFGKNNFIQTERLKDLISIVYKEIAIIETNAMNKINKKL